MEGSFGDKVTKYFHHFNKVKGQYKCQICAETFCLKSFLIKHLHQSHFDNTSLDTIILYVDMKYSPLQKSNNKSKFSPQNNISRNSSRSLPQKLHKFRKPQDDISNSSKIRCKICFKVFQMETELIGHFDSEQTHSIYPNEETCQEEAHLNFKIFVNHIYECKNVHLCYICNDLYYIPSNLINHIKSSHQCEDLAPYIAYVNRHNPTT